MINKLIHGIAAAAIWLTGWTIGCVLLEAQTGFLLKQTAAAFVIAISAIIAWEIVKRISPRQKEATKDE